MSLSTTAGFAWLTKGAKSCTKCKRRKPPREFYKHAGCRGGRNTQCKDCVRFRSRQHHFKNLKKNRARIRAGHFLRTYGITIEQRDALVKQQQGLCAICGRVPKRGRRLHVDHCHSTGSIRGMLCYNCNRILGDCRDDIQVLMAAINYLEGI